MDNVDRKDLVFGHFQAGQGTICVAVLRPPKGSSSAEYKVAFAFGSPTDNPNRRVARKVATGRLFSDRENRNFKFNCDSKRFSDVFRKALEIATNGDFVVEKNSESGRKFETSFVPMWLREALYSSPNCIQAV